MWITDKIDSFLQPKAPALLIQSTTECPVSIFILHASQDSLAYKGTSLIEELKQLQLES